MTGLIDTSTAMTPAQPRMTFPDALRAVAASLVLLPHSVGFFAYWHSPSLPTRLVIRASAYGTFGVYVFFVLSGFVIAYTLRAKRIDARFTGLFIARRSVRLDPPYWCAIGLTLIVVWLQARFGHEPVSRPSAPQLIAHLFYLQDILGYSQINVVFWTLCIELQFYLVYCVLLGLAQRWFNRGGRLISPPWFFVGCLVFAVVYAAYTDAPRDRWFLRTWYAFLIGVCAWNVVDRRLPAIVAWAACVALSVVGFVRHDLAMHVAAITTASLLLAAQAGALYRWGTWRPVQWVAAISYTLYLVHTCVVHVLLPVFVRLKPTAQWTSFVASGIFFAASLAVALLLHRLVERPALAWSQRLKRYERSQPKPASFIETHAAQPVPLPMRAD